MSRIVALCGTLLTVCLAAKSTWAFEKADTMFPALSNEAAWQCLPPTHGDRQEPLPVWARMLAPSLPLTTAAMLELDRVQRQDSTLQPRLRAKVRWLAARANGCDYAEQYARADYLRAGGSAADLAALQTPAPDLPIDEIRLIALSTQLCREAYKISDEDVRQLLETYGPNDLTAIVLVLAYANFQDRLFQALAIEVESDGPLGPPQVQFDWEQIKSTPHPALQRSVPAPLNEAIPTQVDDPRWAASSRDVLRVALNRQQQRTARIAIPPDDVVNRNTPPELASGPRAADIRWNAVTFGYQPRLAAAWIFTLRRFREESGLAEDFRQSVFWVVTRSNQCFY